MLLDFLVQFRWLWISGRPGGGKTALAVYCAQWLCGAGYTRFIASNTSLYGYGDPVAIYTSPEDVYSMGDTVLLLDEAWVHIGRGAQRKDINRWLAYIRKGNNYLICPSVLPLSLDFRVFRVVRMFNAMPFGIPVWWYRWLLDDGVNKEAGRWLWWNPQRVFGVYDHLARPGGEYYVYKA